MTKSEPKGNQKGTKSEPTGAKSELKGSPKGAKGSHIGAKSEPKGGPNALKSRPSEKVTKKIVKKVAAPTIPWTILGAIFDQKSIKKSMRKR